MRLDQRGGDVFAWSTQVSGSADCDQVALLVNGHPAGAAVAVRGGRFTATVPLGEGRNHVVARCGGGNGRAEEARLTFTGRLTARPTARIGVAAEGGTVTLDGGRSQAAEPDGAEVVHHLWSPDPTHPAALTTAAGERFRGQVNGRRLALAAPAEDGEYHVRLTVTDAEGRADTATTYFEVAGGTARAVDMASEHPRWIDSAVIYAPVPALWGDDGPAAVERRLEYLKELGVDALWLWPPAAERAPGQEYAITDYFKLDPSWGPPAAFTSMVEAAHQLGIRVLVDIVPNHLSEQSPYFQDAQQHGTASRYWGFFDRDAGGRPTHYFDWAHLPNLDYDNPEVRRMIVEAFSHWVRELGIDGFRVDAAWGVQERRPDFWPGLRRELKRIDPDILLLAGGSATDPYFFDNGFDVAYDWTDEPGRWAWASVFEFPQELQPLLAAATLQFTVPGIPALFAGDEIGASYQPYSNLTPIEWKDRHGLRPLYQRLAGLKHRVPALNTGKVEVVGSDPEGSFAYLRPAPPGGEPVLVVLNFGGRATVELRRTPGLEAALGGGGALTDLLTDRPVPVQAGQGTVQVRMDAESAHVLTPGGG